MLIPLWKGLILRGILLRSGCTQAVRHRTRLVPIGAFLSATAVMAIPLSPAMSQDIVYQPINPSFGGNPFNSAHLLGIANAQNTFKDPKATSTSSQADIFA